MTVTLHAAVTLLALLEAVPGESGGQFFEARIRPILVERCGECHGASKTRSGLRLDSRAALLAGGRRGPAIIAGDPGNSLLMQAIRRVHPELKMPPDEPLTANEIADFSHWIATGADWPDDAVNKQATQAASHWAFLPVTRPPVPPDASGWSHNQIDCLVLAKLQSEGLRPVSAAEPHAWMRRVSFDLVGLPPRPERVREFLADRSEASYARLVDELLASPRYGERWGRHWMDLVRYADTAGDNADYPIPEAALYRDYIIASFNRDKPYDQFVIEQLAGDIVAARDPWEHYADRIIATGYLALTRRYATAPYELWHLSLEDTIDTTGRAFLGLTLRCARCHDHKFDPITRGDYYALYGIFDSTRFPYAGSEEFSSKQFGRGDFVPLLPPDQAAPYWKRYQTSEQELETRIAGLEKQAADSSELARLREQLRDLKRSGLPSGLPAAYAVREGKPVRAAIQLRGDPGQPGEVVPRGLPAAFAIAGLDDIPEDSSGRLELARWIVHPRNPLTARVIANRIWQHHFGVGLVETPSNLGTSGQPPANQALLDYLACELVDSGWSIKHLSRQIVLSSTYRLSSASDASAAARDPDNRLNWRFSRRRLEAEAIRDAMLEVAGLLDGARPGPHPFPDIRQWGWTQHNPFKQVYESRHRSVYLMTQRIQRHPFLALFDGPDTNTTTGKRSSSTVPLQALYLLNSGEVEGAARSFARRLIAAAPNDAGRIDLAHWLAFSRPAAPDEIELAQEFLKDYAQGLRQAGVVGGQIETEAWASYAKVLFSSNEFFYVE